MKLIFQGGLFNESLFLKMRMFIYFTGGSIDQLRKTGIWSCFGKGKLMIGESAGAIICAQASIYRANG